MSRADQSALENLLRAGVEERVAPSMCAWVAIDGSPRAEAAAGQASVETVFDVASLTKPMVVVTQAMVDVAQGNIQLDDEVELAFGHRRTYRQLLGHRSGLPAWEDLWAVVSASLPGWTPGDPAVWRLVEERIGALLTERPELGVVYSDLGYIQLGRALERLHGRSLRELNPLCGPVARAAPTGPCPRRRSSLMGQVHDLNCWVLGGVAGHAGAFASVTEVGAWALDLLRSSLNQGGRFDGGVVREFWSRENRSGGATWVLGWDTPSEHGSSGGQFMSDEAVGHLGFTGTSVWIDPACGLVAVLLTNRVAGPKGSQERIRDFRRRFHDDLRAYFGLS